MSNLTDTNLTIITDMDKYLRKTFYYIALAILCGIVFAMTAQCVRKCFHDEQPPPVMVERVDTITILKPIAVSETIIREVRAKLPKAPKEDILEHPPLNPVLENHLRDSAKMIRDSVVVEIPITQKVYSDSSYTAFVSGYNPTLDSIRIYVPTFKPPERPRLHLSVGVGAVYNGRFSPGIFVGVSYSFYEIRL